VRRFAPLLLLVALGLAACGDDGGGNGSASAFTATVPDGYHLLAEGHGENPMLWGSDTDGYSTGGFVVLARSEDAEDPADLAVIEATGFQGFQGGLLQTIDRYPETPTEERQVDGQEALVADLDGVTQLVAVRRGDLALSAQSSALDEDELADLVAAADLPDGQPPTGAPDVDPPEGWVALGRATSDLTLGLGAFSYDGYTGGPASASSKAWRAPDGSQIVTVLTLPGAAGDLEAAVGYSLTNGGDSAVETDRFELDGRDAVWIEAVSSRGTIVTTTEWGDLLVVRSAPDQGGAPDPDRDLLAEIAGSVERA
jgi:hypothetical protein